jgi:Tol biopolymer transport system component
MAVPFDLRRLAPAGNAVPLAEQVRITAFTQARAVFSLSENGTLVYQADRFAGALQLTWVDRRGTVVSRLGEPAQFDDVELSPNGNELATSIAGAPTSLGIWIYDVARGFGTRFTSGHLEERDPVWSPDGKTIVFNSNRKGHFDIYQQPADRSRGAELLYADELEKYPSSISPDGRFLLYYTLDDPRGMDYTWVLPLTGTHKPFRLTKETFAVGRFEYAAQFSPNGRWVCYRSNESGRSEVYVVPFPGPGAEVRISPEGGTNPRWPHDGKEIFYQSGDRLTAVEIKMSGRNFAVGRVTTLFGGILSLPGYSYDVSTDGQRFLVVNTPEQSATEPLTLVQNWPDTLRK